MATGRQINWASVGFTPSGGSLTTFTGVTNVSIDMGGQLLGFSGDTDKYSTTKVNVMNEPKCSVESGNPGQFIGIASGTTGTFTATHKDAKGATGGDIVYTLINAIAASPQVGGAHAQFGTGSLPFESFSSDGVTSPLSFVRA